MLPPNIEETFKFLYLCNYNLQINTMLVFFNYHKHNLQSCNSVYVLNILDKHVDINMF